MRLDSGSAKLLDDVAPAGRSLHGDGDLLTTEVLGELIEPGAQALTGSRADLASMQLAGLHLHVVEGDLLSMDVETTYNVHPGPPQAPLFTRHAYGLTASASELGRSHFTEVLLALAFSCHLFLLAHSNRLIHCLFHPTAPDPLARFGSSLVVDDLGGMILQVLDQLGQRFLFARSLDPSQKRK